jgi:hypothetical protein
LGGSIHIERASRASELAARDEHGANGPIVSQNHLREECIPNAIRPAHALFDHGLGFQIHDNDVGLVACGLVSNSVVKS